MPADQLEVKDRVVVVKGRPDKTVTVAEVCYDSIYAFGGRATNFAGKRVFEIHVELTHLRRVFRRSGSEYRDGPRACA